MTIRLCDAALGALPPAVVRPRYARERVTVGVVHLGVGNFHRAHQAVIFDDLLAAGDPRWGVCGVSLRRAAMRDALRPQDGLYTVLERDGAGTRARVVGALRELRVAPEAPGPVIARLAASTTRLVTLTVTEKGYDETGPASALGLLAAGLAARRAGGGSGLSVLCCDNLVHNGAWLRERLLREAHALDPALAGWVGREVVCPDTMVDRIVPATVDADRLEAARMLGCDDAWPVPAEPFLQWVVEDRFAGDAPPLAAAGVQLVADVAPWEAMKLRLLNAAHSSLAYLGAPAGFGTVDAAIAEPVLQAFVLRLWREAASTLPATVRAEAAGYGLRLLARFANPALHHRLLQIAMDGSRKLPQRLIGTLRDARRAAAPHDALVWALAGWMRFLAGIDEQGAALPLDDPLGTRLHALATAPGDATQTVRGLLGVREVFGNDATDDAALVAALAHALGALRRHGSIGALAAAGAPGALSSAAA